MLLPALSVRRIERSLACPAPPALEAAPSAPPGSRSSCKTVDAMIDLVVVAVLRATLLGSCWFLQQPISPPCPTEVTCATFVFRGSQDITLTLTYCCSICHPSINCRLIRQTKCSLNPPCFSWMVCGGGTVFCFVLFLERLEGTAGRKTPTSSSSRPAASKSSLVGTITIFSHVFFWYNEHQAAAG